MNNVVLDIIIALINGTKKENGRIETTMDNNYYSLNNSRYLLGQIIRHYGVDLDHYFISEKAKELWMKISDTPIMYYWYRDTVSVEKECDFMLDGYIGASKKPTSIHVIKGSKFIFKDVFHDEHIVDIKSIIDELIKLDIPNYENVSKILDKIYICRMLKSEDRSIKSKYNRGLDYKKIIDTCYKECGISVISLNSWDEHF